MTPNESLRFSAREAVLFNPNISAGAYRLYMALDSMAGFKGHCWPNQIILAKRLGVTDRGLRKWLSELSDIVSVVHRRGANYYLLAWADQGRKPILLARNSSSDHQQALDGGGRNHSSGNVGTTVPSYNQERESGNNIMLEARGLIEQYPYAKHLPGSPSDSLVEKCLATTGGLDGLIIAMGDLFRSHKRPDLSWGWFPVVLQSYSRRRA